MRSQQELFATYRPYMNDYKLTILYISQNKNQQKCQANLSAAIVAVNLL